MFRKINKQITLCCVVNVKISKLKLNFVASSCSQTLSSRWISARSQPEAGLQFAMLYKSDRLLGQVATQHGQCALQRPREVHANMVGASPNSA